MAKTLEIDGRTVTVPDGTNLVHAAEAAGVEVPHYCYHAGLTVAGNCRMCLVEIEKMPKLQIACNTLANDGMVVRTQVDRVKKAREAVLEFLLINHPIDCPICDQAGECKLQDYYMDYDRRPSRIPLEEKVHKGKALDIGTHVMLDQERCILCTRCVRFLDEVTHTSELGIFNRGDHSEIDLFPDRKLENAYSANVVDICPVGALTAKDFRFKARVWYLEHTSSVCTTCATGCNIDIHHRRGQIYRFRPRYNGEVNQYWLCDEGRFSFERSQSEHRILNPFLRRADQLVPVPWAEVVTEVARSLLDLRTKSAGALAGVISAQATNEEAYLFARLVSEGLGGKVHSFSWSPPDASHDDFLRDRDKNPNSRGLAALGIADGLDALAQGIETGDVKGLFAFRADLGRVLGHERFQALGDKLDYLVVADTDGHPTAGLADAVLPVAAFAETDGTFTNRRGRVQRIREAFPPPGTAMAGWKMLSDLGTRLAHFNAHASADGVFAEIATSHTPFAGLSYTSIGSAGAPLAKA